MRIKESARTLWGIFALCILLFVAGCGSVSNDSSTNSTNLTPALSKPPGDWGATMMAGGTVGIGMFPAKFTFDITSTPDCTNDFLAMNTSLTGVAPGVAASRTGTWTATVATSGTVTIGSTEGSMLLTASTTVNTGTNFQIITSATVEATNLTAAINRNNFATLGPGHPKVRATSAAGVVTVTASADGTTDLKGLEGNSITLAQTINNGRFSWASGTLTGGTGTGNIVAFNKLYSTQGSAGGLCNQDGPSVYWSYFTGTGQTRTSVVLSGDGTKVAFVETVGGGATLRILKWKAGEGSGTGYPATPTTTLSAGQSWTVDCPAANSCIRSIAFNGSFPDTGSAPFYDYNNDVLYVGDDSSRLHKFTGVFLGAPAEVTTGWPIQISGTTNLTSPVYDGVSKNIFVGTDGGVLFFVKEVGSTTGSCAAGSPPCLGSVSLTVGNTNGGITDAPVVDGSTGRVFAVNGNETVNRGTLLQAATDLTDSISFDIGGTGAGSNIFNGAFDNDYVNSTTPNIAGHMYICGKDPANTNRPAVYQLSFTAATGKLSDVGTPLTGLAQANGEACSPVTEIYNANASGGAKDWIFFSIGDNASNTDPIPAGSACRTDNDGCIISIDVTNGPAWPPADVTNARTMPINANGSTSGIVVDNVADTIAAPQASSIYFSLGTNSIATSPCNASVGVGCAVKLTQSALQ